MAKGNPWAGLVRRIDMDRHARQLAAKESAERARLVKPLKFAQRQTVLQEWNRRQEADGFNPAMRWLHGYVGPMMADVHARRSERNIARIESRDTLTEWSSDETVKAWARRRAAEAQAEVARAGDQLRARYAAAAAYVEAWGVESIPMPDDAAADRLQAATWRMSCPRWWRRRARRKLDLDIEHKKIRAGKVRRARGASIYVSKRNMERGEEQARRNAQLMLDLVATNEEGDSFALADLQEKSLANPAVRFAEMMVRLKGCEALADSLGYVGLFYTWTLPSRFHSWLDKGGKNPKWDGSMPRDGHAFLVEQWKCCRASLAKLHARYFGLRVAEPHHAGTPHWHLLLFVRPEHAEAVTDMMRRYAMAESPEETGAKKHRFKVERIDKAKGGATSYVAKYVCKMTSGRKISGETMGEGIERCRDGKRRRTGDAVEAAAAARRWASVHRIRQFQFVGLPPIGIWRECRRIEETPTTDQGRPLAGMSYARIENARATTGERPTLDGADRAPPDYAAHVRALGGVVPRCEQKLMVRREVDGTINAYGELRPPQTVGVSNRLNFVNVRPATVLRRRKSRPRKDGSVSITLRRVQVQQREVIAVQGLGVVTRLHQWAVSFRHNQGAVQMADPAAGAPWTRVNNCNHPEGGEEGRAPLQVEFPPPGAAPPPLT